MLVNVAVQLDREAQRNPCFNTPRGRGNQTGDINVPKSAEVASLLQEAEWLAETVSGRHCIQKQREMQHRAPADLACQVKNT